MAKILNISGTEIKDSGIQKLADYVEAHLSDEFTLVIGCKPSIYDVDAVLIAGGNIFAIECKDWKGTISGGSYGWWQKDGQVIENPLQQTRNNAAALGKWLREKLKNIEGSIWVKGILLFTHEEGNVNIEIDKTSNTGVEILDLNDLGKYMSKVTVTKNNEIGKNVINFFYYYIQEKSMKSTKLVKYLNYTCVGLLFIVFGAMIALIKGNDNAIPIMSVSAVVTIILSFISAAVGNTSDEDNNLDENFLKEYDSFRDYSFDPHNYFGTYKK